MIIDGKVYDVTEFANEHPGGIDTLLQVAGSDGTDDFDGVGHSDSAKAQLKTFLKGQLSKEEAALSPKKSAVKGTQGSNAAIAFVVVLLAVVMYLVLKP